MLHTVRERLAQYLKVKKISKSAFGRSIGASSAFVTSIQKTIGADKIKAITLNYPDLNIEWLLTGEGDMIKAQAGNMVVTGNVSGSGNNIVAGNNNRIGAPKAEDVEVIDSEDVEIKVTPIITPEILSAEDVDIKRGLETGTLGVKMKPTQDVLPPHHAKVYTENDEMAPDIEANDPVFVKFLNNKCDFISGRMYFVDLDNGSVVRWVVREDQDHVRLISMKDEEVIPFSRICSISFGRHHAE